ncbi:polyphosphate polymerase domain-containing protein [Desulfoplanes formicivorans]|uniref:VTC domain-containing protein n=1 Tax=Desulfoplanes formicivorans TaxID=1592317 RepID=A0A194ADW4_9BACT|nr:polyphosphate polymerase domain-containing protein [Desulfoplanes formicivorans]GAU08267.1 hypothetical protein DPF_0970 [Desulfoplanes formicivorans]
MQLRYERKYLVPEDQTSQLAGLLNLHPACFREVYPPRFVNSIYFDDPQCTNWQQSEEGFCHRRKIRIRWYGALQGTIREPRLEIKSKQGHLGRKTLFPMSQFTMGSTMDMLHIKEIINGSDIPKGIRHLMQLYTPSLMNRYHRTYLLSADGHYRLTIDRNITYFPLTSHFAHIGTGMTDPITTVLELKYDRSMDSKAPSIARYWPFRLSRKSKYATGMNLTRFALSR